jgi:hypothetical protein
LPAVFGSLAKHNIVGKLPTIAGWQPALPRQEKPAMTGRHRQHARRARYPELNLPAHPWFRTNRCSQF